AEISQPEYSAFERLKRKLNLDDADNLSRKVWGQPYTNFVAFSKEVIQVEELPSLTIEAIKESEENTLRDPLNLLAKELDRLIADGHFNSPTTSKLTHAEMDGKL